MYIFIVLERPWLEDSYDQFEQRYMSQRYRCAVIFVDNSGCDCILGVIPFARELARAGTKVNTSFVTSRRLKSCVNAVYSPLSMLLSGHHRL